MDAVVVGIADGKTVRYPGKLVTYALGSCVGICLYFDIQKYTKTGFTFDREFFISLVFYVLLTVLGIRSILKGRKLKKDE